MTSSYRDDAGVSSNDPDNLGQGLGERPEALVTFDGHLGSSLKIDPAVLVGFGGKDPTADQAERHQATSRRGLNHVMRRVLALAQTLAHEEKAAIRLKTEATAQLNGWPNATIANVAMVLVWALLDENRLILGLPSVPLLVADDQADQVLDPGPTGTAGSELPSAAELVDRLNYAVVLTPDMVARRERILAGEPSPVVGTRVASPNQMIRDTLGLDPEKLARVLDPHNRWPEYSYAVDPEGAGRAGLLRLTQDAFDQYRTMRAREVEEIRLMTEADAKVARWPDAHSANFATLLSAGLLAEGDLEPFFEAARPVSPEEIELQKAVAKHVYFFGSAQSLQGLELICDSNVHFGVYHGIRPTTRLLEQVRKDHDPSGVRYEQLPFMIAADMMFVDIAEQLSPED